MNRALVLIVAFGCMAVILTHRHARPVVEAAPAPRDEREQFAIDLLGRLGNTQPSGDTIAMIVEWTRAEDSSEGALGRNNPLNTTRCLPGRMTGAINDDGACGVQGYATWEDGVEATALTLLQPNFSAIVAALQANDAEGARQALWASGWAESHYGYGASWARALPTVAQFQSAPIAIGGDACGENVRVALEANGGALRNVAIRPGETFSFNATLGNPDATAYQMCAGVPGGNWCNLAARYAQVARAMGLQLDFLHHGVDLGAGLENDVLIWNVGGVPGFDAGRQDLLITNTTPRPVRLVAVDTDGGIAIVGGVE